MQLEWKVGSVLSHFDGYFCNQDHCARGTTDEVVHPRVLGANSNLSADDCFLLAPPASRAQNFRDIA